MLCQNCNCKISSEFKYSIITNCCPKCGKQMMSSLIKDIYKQILSILDKDDNDLGDVAIWFSKFYKLNSESSNIELTHTQELVDNSNIESIEDNIDENIKSKPISKPKPIMRTNAKSPQLVNRAELFNKRAGVNIDNKKIKSLIEDIQGVAKSDIDLVNDNDIIDDDTVNMDELNGSNEVDEGKISPLSQYELNAVSNMFDSPPSNETNYSEIEKLKKIEQFAETGSIGLIKRV